MEEQTLKVPTIFDVARAAGVSKSTVSRVINGHGYVSPAVMARVTRVIAALGYSPNSLARGLVLQRSNCVGVIVSDIADPFFSQAIRGAEETSSVAHYNILLASTGWDAKRELALLKLFNEGRVDGLLFISGNRVPEPHLRALKQGSLPIVLVDRNPENVPLDAVNVDNRGAAEQAVEHLIALGHTRIAFIGGPASVNASQERLEGYRSALWQHGIPVRPDYVAVGNFRIDGGVSAAAYLLALPEPPTAIFAANDLTAVGAIQAARQAGRRVPDDVSILGVDDIEAAALIEPPLTTLRQPRYQLGELGMKILLRRIEEGAGARRVEEGASPGLIGQVSDSHRLDIQAPVSYRLPMELVVRRSTGPVPTSA